MKSNRYPATCIICGCRVPKNGGVTMHRGGKWLTAHTMRVDMMLISTLAFVLYASREG